jgi:hypothetical protein
MFQLGFKLISGWVKSIHYFPFILLLTCPVLPVLVVCQCVCFSRFILVLLYCCLVGVRVRGVMVVSPWPVLVCRVLVPVRGAVVSCSKCRNVWHIYINHKLCSRKR